MPAMSIYQNTIGALQSAIAGVDKTPLKNAINNICNGLIQILEGEENRQAPAKQPVQPSPRPPIPPTVVAKSQKSKTPYNLSQQNKGKKRSR
jgi:hypothetical protein